MCTSPVKKSSSPSIAATADKSTNKERKTVSFYPQLRVRRCLHLNDMSSEEIEASFFQPDEYDMIHENVVRAMLRKEEQQEQQQQQSQSLSSRAATKKYQRRTSWDDIGTLCFRGVDTWQEREQKRLRRQMAVDAVLEAQELVYKYRTQQVLRSLAHEHGERRPNLFDDDDSENDSSLQSQGSSSDKDAQHHDHQHQDQSTTTMMMMSSKLVSRSYELVGETSKCQMAALERGLQDEIDSNREETEQEIIEWYSYHLNIHNNNDDEWVVEQLIFTRGRTNEKRRKLVCGLCVQ